MKIIAVTGGIGSGKSTVVREFGRLGAYIISADKISHDIMHKGEKAYEETVKSFGAEILCGNGEIDRKALGEIVFADNDKLEILNEITHKYIYEEMKRRIDESGAELVCLEIPLLFSAPCPVRLDLKIAVIADRDIRTARVVKRDGCTAEQAAARMASQIGEIEMRRLADCVIENNGGLEDLKRQTEKIFRQL